VLADQGGQSALLCQQSLAHRLLEKAITRGHEPVLGQVVPEFPEHIDRFAAHPGGQPSLGGQASPLLGIAGPVIAERQDDPLLPEPGHLGDRQVRARDPREVAFLDVPGVLGHLVAVEGEEHLPGFEIAKL
jgi:hypothetical protein